MFKITTPEALIDRIEKTALLRAGIIESLRYFSYAQGLLMDAFGSALGAFMSFVYFGSAHMGVMNLIVLPVSFLFVYFHRTYRLIIPLIIFHMLGDSAGFIQSYLTYKGLYLYNLAIFLTLLCTLWIFRGDIKAILASIGKVIKHDYSWLRANKLKALSLSLILPLWLHLLLFIEEGHFW